MCVCVCVCVSVCVYVCVYYIIMLLYVYYIIIFHACLAHSSFYSCLGYNNVVQGSCASMADPCSSSPCPSGTKCVPNRQVCLSVDKGADCPQFSCGGFFFFNHLLF